MGCQPAADVFSRGEVEVLVGIEEVTGATVLGVGSGVSEADVDDFMGFKLPEAAIGFIPYRDTYLKGQREVVDRFVPAEHADKPFSRWKGKLINDPLATIIFNGRVIGVWEWNDRLRSIAREFGIAQQEVFIHT